MNFKGRVEAKVDKSGVSKKDQTPFKSFQYWVIETEGQYPQEAVLETYGDKVPDLEVGDEAEFEFNMRVNKWQDKFFGSNSVWRITKLDGSSQQPPVSPPPTEASSTDDLPF